MHDFLMKCENFDNSNYQNIKKTILGDKINKKHVRTANNIVNKDVALGKRLGINSTPTFLICHNNKIVKCVTLNQVIEYIEKLENAR